MAAEATFRSFFGLRLQPKAYCSMQSMLGNARYVLPPLGFSLGLCTHAAAILQPGTLTSLIILLSPSFAGLLVFLAVCITTQLIAEFSAKRSSHETDSASSFPTCAAEATADTKCHFSEFCADAPSVRRLPWLCCGERTSRARFPPWASTALFPYPA